MGVCSKLKILVIDNHLVTKMTGGTYHIISVSKKWSQKSHIDFLLPDLAFKSVKDILGGNVHVSTNPFEKKDDSMDGTTLGAIKRVILYNIRTMQASFSMLKNYPEIVIASTHYPHDVIPAILWHLRLPRSKLVVYVHGMFPEVPETHGTFLRVISLINNYLGGLLAIKFAELLFVFNKHTKKYLKHLGAKVENISLTNNPIDIQFLPEIAQPKLFDACFLGRIVPSKGIFDLVKVWKEVCSKNSNRASTLLVIGAGQIDVLTEAAKRENITENIMCVGYVSEEKKFELLKRSKLFLFPSLTEGWGIAVAEAMTCGLPVVAYNLPVYGEVFKDKIITVPMGDVSAMVQKVIYLLDNPIIAEEMGRTNNEFVANFNCEKISDKEFSTISSLLKLRGKK